MADNLPAEQPYQNNLGNVIALQRSVEPPTKRYILWSAVLDPTKVADMTTPVEIRKFDFLLGRWVPFDGTGFSGSIDASKVLVKLEGVTEAVGGRDVSDFDGTLLQLLTEVFIRYRAPSISFFSFMGSGSRLMPIGYPFPGGSQPFLWATNNADNVALPPGLTLRDVTAGRVLASNQSPANNGNFQVDGFTVVEGLSRQYELGGQDKNGLPFGAEISIVGSVYRYMFVSDRDLLGDQFSSDAQRSAFVRQQYKELNGSRASGPTTYSPRGQYVYFIFDRRGLDNSELGAAFKVEGTPNNDFLTRDYRHTNEYGAQNDMRIFRTGNLLEADYQIQSL